MGCDMMMVVLPGAKPRNVDGKCLTGPNKSKAQDCSEIINLTNLTRRLAQGGWLPILGQLPNAGMSSRLTAADYIRCQKVERNSYSEGHISVDRRPGESLCSRSLFANGHSRSMLR